MRWMAWAAALTGLMAASASGQDMSERRCTDSGGRDRCSPEQQARVRALFGVRAIEEHRDAGDEVLRAFYVDGYGHDMIAIAFVRPRGADPELRVHFKQIEGEPDLEPLRAPVPEAAWDEIIGRSEHFDRELVPVPPTPGEIVLCVHPWVYTVEGTSPARSEEGSPSLRRRTEGACANGLTAAFARELYRAALDLLPHCARLRLVDRRSDVAQLSWCGILRGDRFAAAAVMSSAQPLLEIDRIEDAEAIDALLDPLATIDWDGAGPAGTGNEAAARFLVEKALEAGRYSFYVDSVDGLSADRVRLRGGFARFIEYPGAAEPVMEVAPAELIWRRDGRDFAVTSVTVGRYAPAARR